MRAARARKSLTPPPSLSRSLKRRQTWAPAFWDVGGASTSQACTAARQGEATQGPPGGRRLVSSSVYLGFPVSPSEQRPRGQGLVLSWRVPLLYPHPPPAHYRVSSRVSALHDAAAVYQSARLMWREQTAPPSPSQKRKPWRTTYNDEGELLAHHHVPLKLQGGASPLPASALQG